MLEIFLGLALLAYMFIDVNYFLRIIVLYVIDTLFKPRMSILDTSSVYGITLFFDVDQALDHMNNAKLIRELDFGRIDYGIRTGALSAVLPRGGAFPVNANYIRYRLPLKLFSVYRIDTRLLSWDDKALFFEQKVISVPDGIVRAVAYPKISCYKFSGDQVVEELLPGAISPELELRLKMINEIGDITSEKFKNGKKTKSFADNINEKSETDGSIIKDYEKNR